MEGELEKHTQRNEYIILPTKRKLEANDVDIVKRQKGVKIQKYFVNSCNSPEKEEMNEILFTDIGWNCGRYKLSIKSVMTFDRLKIFEERYDVKNDPIVRTDDAGVLLQLTYRASKKQKGDIIYAADVKYEVGTIDDYNAEYFNFLLKPYQYVVQSDYKLWPVIRDFVTDCPLLFRNDDMRDKYISYTNEGVHILSQIMIGDIDSYKKLRAI